MRTFPALTLIAASVATAPALAAYPTDGWTLPMKAAKLTPAQTDAIMRAAGFAKAGRQWKGCDGSSTASIDDAALDGGAIRDLNGDGRPEVIVMDEGIACYGNTGVHFTIVTPTPTGWKSWHDEVGIPKFLTTKGVGGWADIEVGGPGFCFPVQRWNGKDYTVIRNQYDGKPCRR
jgi:hypothetical protein